MRLARVRRADKNGRVLSESVDKEIDREWSRKSGFENRAFAVFSLNLGVATLYLVLREQFKLSALINGSNIQVVLWGSLIAIVLSTMAAVLASAPGNYPGLDPDALDAFRRRATTSSVDYELRIARTKISVLRAILRTNRRRARWTIASLILSSLATVGFAIVLTMTAAQFGPTK